MRLMSFILAAYLFALTAVSCGDATLLHCEDNETTIQSAHCGDHCSENDCEGCTPFCGCNCCQSVVQITYVAKFHHPIMILANIPLLDLSPEPHGFNNLIWQPPRQV
jgi:hypothetical protein